MTQSDFDKSILALTLWREARGEGMDGMRAVGCVIRNRVTPTMGWARVIEAKWQFSSLTAPGDPELVLWPLPDDLSWQSAMVLAEGVYNGSLTDNTGGATHYFNPSVVLPKWAATLTKTLDIGNHAFYR